MFKLVQTIRSTFTITTSLVLTCLLLETAWAEKGRTGQVVFESAEQALEELKAAAKTEDSARMAEIFGKNAKEIFISGDPVSDAAVLRRLSLRFDQRAELIPVTSSNHSREQWYYVRYGIEGWNMHVPLVDRGKGWSFATEYATIANLKIRRALNEVATVDTLQALFKAQEAYKKQDWNDDGIFEYAQRIISTPGKEDGLYWPNKDGDLPSPIDGLVARAMQDGYKASGKDTPTYGGYVYKILTEQAGKTRGGKKSYLKDGHMVNGFAILAYPVKWNASGDFCFVIGTDAQVWKRDFGPRTDSIAPKIESMDLDSLWLRADPHLGGKNSRSNW